VAFISALMEAGVEFAAVDFPQANRLTVHILAAVAEHEAAMISARTKAALAAAKKRGVVLGGDRAGIISSQSPKGIKASIKVRREKARRRAADLLPTIDEIRAEGTTSALQIAAALNERGIHAAKISTVDCETLQLSERGFCRFCQRSNGLGAGSDAIRNFREHGQKA